MRVIRRRMGGQVALINRLIAAFHGSETLKKLFLTPLQARSPVARGDLAIEFRIKNAWCARKTMRTFGDESRYVFS